MIYILYKLKTIPIIISFFTFLQKSPHSPRKLIKQSALDSPEDHKSSAHSSTRRSMNYGNDLHKHSNNFYNR